MFLRHHHRQYSWSQAGEAKYTQQLTIIKSLDADCKQKHNSVSLRSCLWRRSSSLLSLLIWGVPGCDEQSLRCCHCLTAQARIRRPNRKIPNQRSTKIQDTKSTNPRFKMQNPKLTRIQNPNLKRSKIQESTSKIKISRIEHPNFKIPNPKFQIQNFKSACWANTKQFNYLSVWRPESNWRPESKVKSLREKMRARIVKAKQLYLKKALAKNAERWWFWKSCHASRTRLSSLDFS